MHSRMAGGELGRQFLNPLQMDIRQDQWNAGNNCLTSGGTASGQCGFFPAWLDPASQILYTPNHVISGINIDPATPLPLGNLRRVVLTITWQERNPN